MAHQRRKRRNVVNFVFLGILRNYPFSFLSIIVIILINSFSLSLIKLIIFARCFPQLIYSIVTQVDRPAKDFILPSFCSRVYMEGLAGAELSDDNFPQFHVLDPAKK